MVDLFATLAAIVGERDLDPTTIAPDIYNFLPAFLGKKSAQPLRSDLILQSANGVYAIRSGPWKWIEGVPHARPGRKPPGKNSPKAAQFRPQLINLEADPCETTDLAAQHPAVVKRLSTALQRYRSQSFSRE